MRINQNIADYVAIAETEGLSYEEKLERYRALADCYFEREKFEEFAAEVLPHLDELMAEELASPEFDALLVDVITRGEPAELHERLIDRCPDAGRRLGGRPLVGRAGRRLASAFCACKHQHTRLPSGARKVRRGV